VEQLRLLVKNSPEILEAVLQDATWESLVKSLSPRDFCSVIQQAGCKGSIVACTLAQTMRPQLECRHVLACIYALPESQRTEVVRLITPFVSDLQSNQFLLEQELSQAERVHFREALQVMTG
jgi:hypothetical protein